VAALALASLPGTAYRPSGFPAVGVAASAATFRPPPQTTTFVLRPALSREGTRDVSPAPAEDAFFRLGSACYGYVSSDIKPSRILEAGMTIWRFERNQLRHYKKRLRVGTTLRIIFALGLLMAGAVTHSQAPKPDPYSVVHG